jgi:ubiquinone/menaquinone biosynthesis C-methylase UbiE
MDGWRSYDHVAEIYDRVHAPRLAEPARDLVELASPASGGRVLDVGTGTGVAAQQVLSLVGPDVQVTGIDHSMGMLEVGARVRQGILRAAAEAIDLPFRDASFDVVVANFVLAHFTKYETALFDLVRVLRPGGRLAVSTWADRPDTFQKAWMERVEEVIPQDVLVSALGQAVPWQDRFMQRGPIEEALLEAGLRSVRTEPKRYRWTYSVDDYVDGLTVWAVGRFARDMLGDEAFASFVERVKTEFRNRFSDPLNDFRDVIIAVGTRV